MIGVGMTAAALAALYLFATRKDRDLPAFLYHPRLRRVMLLVPIAIG